MQTTLAAVTCAAILYVTSVAAAQRPIVFPRRYRARAGHRREGGVAPPIQAASRAATALYIVSVVHLIASPVFSLVGFVEEMACVFESFSGRGDRCSAADVLYVSSAVAGGIGVLALPIAIGLDVDATSRRRGLQLGVNASPTGAGLRSSAAF